MVRVRWTTSALQDLQLHLEHLHEIDPLLAGNAARKVREAVELLEIFPEMGRLDTELGVREYWVPGTRLLLIHAAATDDVVDIIAVFHTSRDPRDKPSVR